MQGSGPVNIDSVTRREVEAELENPTPQIFTKAQQHVSLDFIFKLLTAV